MERRAISAEEVVDALNVPETTYSSARQPERVVVLGRTRAARRLKVVVARDDPALVITVAGRDEEG
jgi:LmbE family N-acetylglucosaminyl deacetylase